MGFPNLKGKHAEDSMFSPEEFLEYYKKTEKELDFDPPSGVIFCYDSDLIKHIIAKHRPTKIGAFKGELYLIHQGNKTIGVMANFGIGAPIATTILEELIAFGVKKFISIGTAGTLQKKIKIGNLMICEKAIRDEGTSHHYLKGSKYSYASKKTTQKIKKAFDKHNQKYFVGTSWTIDAPYRETVAEAKQYQKEGVAAVEMELAALFAVAQYRKVEMGAVVTISDSLSELKWKPMFHSKKAEKGLEMSYKIAVESLLK
jgi:uridine phosphorylase